MDKVSRRRFLKFMGVQAAITGVVTSRAASSDDPKETLPVKSIKPTRKDDLVLAEGLSYNVLVSWEDRINARKKEFGYDNDFIAVIPDEKNPTEEAILWVNHESAEPFFVSGHRKGRKKNRAQIMKEMKAVGGSILRIRKEGGKWKFIPNDPINKRVDGMTPCRIISEHPVAQFNSAVGTLANCAGGVTPWRTILTCEENYQKFYGEVVFKDGVRYVEAGDYDYKWGEFYPRPPEHYGWVVEVDPQTAKCKKLTALGRFAHECATTIKADDGRCVVYTGDDMEDQCLYKFISSKPGSLEEGMLYVADVKSGKWLALDWENNLQLKKKFANKTEMLVRTREAAHMLGGTPLDRPEDIEIDPSTKHVYVTLTNNKPKKVYHGSILKIMEKDNNPLSETFTAETFLTGGEATGFSCPDNMVFDSAGNLWITSDISESSIGKKPYESFGNNGLFYVPLKGSHAGKVFQVASAPVDAELTGPCFTPDGKTLLLSVQHPGASTEKGMKLTSNWPGGGASTPRPSVVAISGPLLDRLIGGS